MADRNDKLLLPCPFCGEDDCQIVPDHYGENPDYWEPICHNCGCRLLHFTTEEHAIEAWNTRKEAGQ